LNVSSLHHLWFLESLASEFLFALVDADFVETPSREVILVEVIEIAFECSLGS
jgi:hypothetical protein